MRLSPKIEKHIEIPTPTHKGVYRKVIHYKKCDLPIDQALVKQALIYDPVTGHFTWNEGHGDEGKRAGSTCSRHGYRYITIYGKRCIEHRLAWIYTHGVIKPHHHICHVNKIRDDNSLSNLLESKNTSPFRPPRPVKPKEPKPEKPSGLDKMMAALQKSRDRIESVPESSRRDETLILSDIMAKLKLNGMCKNTDIFGTVYLGQGRTYWNCISTEKLKNGYKIRISLESILHLKKRLLSISDTLDFTEECLKLSNMVDSRIVLKDVYICLPELNPEPK